MKLFHLTIARVDMPLFDGEAAALTAPGVAGEFTVLADHVAIISPLKAGTLVVKRENAEEETINIEGGTLEMSNNQATVLI